MPRALDEQTVVITGASGGIGRAAARAFAAHGARVVVAARREQALEDVRRECEERGGQALVAPTDVRDPDAVDHLARRAVEHFGRIDTWVNNAAVTLFGLFEEIPGDVYRKVLETNLFGYLHGARAALPRFREQGEGVLVNVSSVVASAPQPYTSAYVTSKTAIHGLTDCLRMELSLDRDDDHDIHVSHVMPASIDTPLFQQAANFTGRAIKPMDPVYAPERVAAAIVEVAQRPRAQVIVGPAGRFMRAERALMPGLYIRTGARMVDRDHFQVRPAEPTEGNVFVPMPHHAGVHGGWRTNSNGKAGRAALLGALAAAAPVAAWAWWTGRLPGSRTSSLSRLGG